MTTEIQTQAAKAQEAIFVLNYYVPEYLDTLKRHSMNVDDLKSGEITITDKQLVEMFHTFWEELPDSPEIRRAPFFAICDIAQNLFDM